MKKVLIIAGIIGIGCSYKSQPQQAKPDHILKWEQQYREGILDSAEYQFLLAGERELYIMDSLTKAYFNK